MKELIKAVEKYAHDNLPYPKTAYGVHIEAVRKYSLELASELKADKDVVEVSALLHDTGVTIDVKNHHVESAKIATKLLGDYGCDKKFIEHVADCILSHRSSRKEKAKTIEAQIIKDADSLAYLDVHAGMWLTMPYFTWTQSKSDFEEGIRQTRTKIQRMYDKIETKEGKKLAKPNYDELMRMLSFLK